MLAAALAEGLPVTGQVADIRDVRIDGTFDILLINRTLHMLDRKDRTAVLSHMLGHVAANGWLLLLDERSNMPGFRSVVEADPADWNIDRQKGGLLFAQRQPDG